MTQKKVMIMEADQAFAMMLSNTLEANKYQVAIPEDGSAAAECVRREKPNLILLCVELSEGNGYLVCKEFKEDKDLRKIPLILMSSQATPEDFDKHRKLKVRAEDYLIKPFTDDDLLQKVENLVGFHISEEEYAALQEQVASVLEEKIALEGKLTDKEGELASVREKLRSSVKEADALREKLESVERKLKDMMGRVQKAEDRISELGENVSRHEERGRKLEADRRKLDEERKRLRDLIARAKGVLEGG